MTPGSVEATAQDPPWDAFTEHAYDSGWTDGLPVIPPTRARVEAMIAGAAPDTPDPLCHLAPRMGAVTLERLAANAVMAGCLPEHFPIVVAALQGIAQDGFNPSAIQPTTNPVGPLVLVNGPIAAAAGLNAGSGCFGPGTRANATIGRAVRLALINIGGGIPGTVDRATHGFPGKYSLCTAENEAESPWEPFHVRRGFDPQDSVVTVFAACGFLNMLDQSSPNGHELLQTLAGSMRFVGSNNVLTGRGQVFVVLGPKHARIIAGSGYSVDDVREYLYEHTTLPLDALPPAYRAFVCRRREIDPETAEVVTIGRSYEDVEVIVAGGAGNHSVFLPGYGDNEAPSVQVQR